MVSIEIEVVLLTVPVVEPHQLLAQIRLNGVAGPGDEGLEASPSEEIREGDAARRGLLVVDPTLHGRIFGVAVPHAAASDLHLATIKDFYLDEGMMTVVGGGESSPRLSGGVRADVPDIGAVGEAEDDPVEVVLVRFSGTIT